MCLVFEISPSSAVKGGSKFVFDAHNIEQLHSQTYPFRISALATVDNPHHRQLE